MSKISLEPNASGAGTFSIVSPDSNTNRTLNLPDESGILFSDGSGVPGSAVTGQLASSNMPAGSVIQVVQTYKTNTFTRTATSEDDIPGMSVDITPSSASSKIMVMVTLNWSSDGSSNVWINLKRGSTYLGRGTGGSRDNGFYSSNVGATDNRIVTPTNINYLDSPSTTSTINYRIVVQSDNDNLFTVNTRAINSFYGSSSHITAMEIAG